MDDINLLPENLREKELAARKEAAKPDDNMKLSRPGASAQAPSSGEAPGRWQQFMSALKKNVETPTTATWQAQRTPASPIPPKNGNNNLTTTHPAVVAMPKVEPVAAKKAVPHPVVPAPATAPAKPNQPPIRTFSVTDQPKRGVPPPLLDVNLLPQQTGAAASRQSKAAMVMVVIGAVILVAVTYGLLRFYVVKQKSASEAVQQEVISLQEELETARAAAEKAITSQARLAALAKLLDQQGHWQKFFTLLEKNTLPNVQLNNLAVDATGKVTLSGATLSYTEVGRQMLAWQQNKDVKSVALTSISMESGATSKTNELVLPAKFSFALEVDPALFNATP